jgi:replication-associated recombination protein RarA
MTMDLQRYLTRKFVPACPDELCGPAQRVAIAIDRLLSRRAEDGLPIKVMLKGPPGTGKSTLARYLIKKLGCLDQPWCRYEFSGTDLKIDAVNELCAKLAYRTLGGGWTALWIEEADAIPMVAQTRFLKFMDDLPNHVAVVATSNASDSLFEERFQSRFPNTWTVDGPSLQELEAFLSRWSAETGIIQSVARCACGIAPTLRTIPSHARANVRQAIGDLDNALLCVA